MNKSLFAILAASFLGFAPMDAYSCSCMTQGNILDRKALSDRVFSGRLVSEKVDSVQGTKRMVFSVHKAWKQGRREWVKRIRVETALESAACGFEMKVGDRAIIFTTAGKENGRKVNLTNLCSENIVNPGRRQLDSLGMKAPRRPVPQPIKADES